MPVDGIDVYDVDLFDVSAQRVAQLQATGARVVCYMSAGGSEEWRPDVDQFATPRGADTVVSEPSAGSASENTGTSEDTASTAQSTAAPGGQNIYSANGVSFAYPATLQDVSDKLTVNPEVGEGDALWTAGLAPAATGSERVHDIIMVEAYALDTPVTADNLDDVTPQLTSFTEDVYAQLDGTVEYGPDDITVGGLPGVQYNVKGKVDGTTPIDGRLAYAFDGTTEHFVNCQYTEAAAAEIIEGCDHVLNTFTLE